MFNYIIALVLLLVSILTYFRLADHYNIIDKPNQRSSHTYITVRGGGIVFPVAVILWFLFFGFENVYMVAGLMAMAVISFIDDVKTLSGKVRIAIHLLSVSLLFYQLALFGLPWWLVLVAYVLTIGWINAFNFMDGINGITVLYALVALFTFSWLNYTLQFTYDSLIILIILSGLLIAWFNLRRRARCFAGDVGSVSMAFVLAWLMLSLMLHTGRVEYILFFALYGIDSVVTIIFRILKRENIFTAHRSHLYQLLANELKWPHVHVSAVYAAVQVAINTLTIIFIKELSPLLTVIVLLLLASVYLAIRYKVKTIVTNRENAAGN